MGNCPPFFAVTEIGEASPVKKNLDISWKPTRIFVLLINTCISPVVGKTTLAVTAATCRGGTAHVYPLGGTTHVYPLWWDFIGGIFLAVTAVTRPKVCFSCVTGNVCPKFEVTYVPGASSQSNFSRAEQENKGDDRFFYFMIHTARCIFLLNICFHVSTLEYMLIFIQPNH